MNNLLTVKVFNINMFSYGISCCCMILASLKYTWDLDIIGSQMVGLNVSP